jgi:hypothetical protein
VGHSLGKRVRLLVILILIGYFTAFSVRLRARKYDIFFPDYVRWLLTRPPQVHEPVQVFVVFVDHFEPDYDAKRVASWLRRYRTLASRHRDFVGRPPQHTFFYPGEQRSPEIYCELRGIAHEGLGEVELHYHHDFDTAQTLAPKLSAAISDFQDYGFLRTVDGQTKFAFIHGNWGLDNSNGPMSCGVNHELRLLKELGCFADFTFPSVYFDAQPPFANRIYAARDDEEPKSYQRAYPLAGPDDFVIFQGPLLFAPSTNVRHLFFDLEDGDIHPAVPASPARADRWVRANVHLEGRPDWVFVKVFAHGISTPGDEDAVLGRDFDATLSYLERQYNDGTHYQLRYVTARQAYNLALAAASGATGGPEPYLDHPIRPYVANQ